MLQLLAAVALVMVFLGPAVAAFAGEREDEGDRALALAAESAQFEPGVLGTVAGTETPYVGPYVELRLDNMGR